MTIHCRWPATDANSLVPWYAITWRALWMPLMLVGRLLFVFGALCGYGADAADDAWEATR